MSRMTKIDRRNVEDIIGLSPIQGGILFHYLLDKSSLQYFEQYSYRLKGTLELEKFYEAWKLVIGNNEMLRAVYRWKEVEEPIQIILKHIPFRMNYIDLTLVHDDSLKDTLNNIKDREREIKFNLLEGPLLRLNLCKLKEGTYEMIVNNHHILFDGWSYIIILKEFLQVYNSLIHGVTPILERRLKFKEYLKWLKNQSIKDGEAFWHQYLKEYIPRNLLPADHKCSDQCIDTVNHSTVLIPQLVERIQMSANDIEVTLGTILTAAWGLLLQFYNNSRDVTIGVTTSGRSSVALQGIETLVGLVINTLPLRLKCCDEEKVESVIKKVGQDEIERQEYEFVPLTNINTYRSTGKETRLFDSIIVIENYPIEGINRDDYKLKIENYSGFGVTNYDLVLAVNVYNEITLNFIYNAGIFDEITIKLMGERYISILKAIAENYKCTVRDLMHSVLIDNGFPEDEDVRFCYSW